MGGIGAQTPLPAKPACFKSCPRVGGISCGKRVVCPRKVSSRAPVWGASCGAIHKAALNQVSSRAPVWGASLPQAGWNWRHLRFKSCPRVGGIPGGFRILRLDIQFQVVPPCGGHQRWELYRKAAAEVSSRAPVWGASSWARRQRIVDSFQVVPPCGGHREKFQSSLFAQFVSSRAPVWGASKIMAAALAPCQFQVVPPCGGHLRYQYTFSIQSMRFKSCPRVGGILCITEDAPNIFVSSRAPVWGASSQHVVCSAEGTVSSRAPVWGASSKCRIWHRAYRFQVVPPCGGHPLLDKMSLGWFNVSSRAPVWGASCSVCSG